MNTEEYGNRKERMGIYLHIPFCVRKCAYCDFLSAPADEETREAYVRALTEEIRAFPDPDRYLVRSVFFGGGTPSLLAPAQTERILDAVRARFSLTGDAEITAECNPGTLSREKLSAYRGMGISRLSIGLQSANDAELALLGRIHTFAVFRENYELAREAGFDNLNVDLIFGLPGQKRADWAATLAAVTALSPEHISAYSLIIEDGTPFGRTYGEDALRREEGLAPRFLPDEEEERGMSEDTVRILEEAGLSRYEISNYARPGRGSVHNTGYWTREAYAGFGIGAASLLGHERTKNTEDLAAYLRGERSAGEREVLSREDEMAETMFLGLRLIRGVNLTRFARTFGERAQDRWAREIAQMTAEGLLETADGHLRLTPRGLDLANYVMAAFV